MEQPKQMKKKRRNLISFKGERKSPKEFLVYAFLLNLGLFLTAAGIHLFKTPNHFAMGGTSGMSIIMATLWPKMNVGGALFIINGILVALGIIFLGVKTMGVTIYSSFALSAFVSIFEHVYPMSGPFTNDTFLELCFAVAFLGVKTMGVTIYSSFALSAFVSIFEHVYPMSGPFTNDTFLELCFAVALPAAGSAIVFNVGASTGGTDIVAMILSKYTSMEIGRALLISDLAIAAWAHGHRGDDPIQVHQHGNWTCAAHFRPCHCRLGRQSVRCWHRLVLYAGYICQGVHGRQRN